MIKSFRFRWVCIVALLGVAPACAHLDPNFRAVEKGAFYRSGQMDGRYLSQVISRHGVATVINLRGVDPDEKWYQTERAVCADRGVAHHDLTWSMSRLPEPDSLAQYVALLKAAEYPVLVHCQAGIHRAGVASACYLLLQGAGPGEARGQFGLFFDNAPIGRLVDLYQGSATPFDEWVATEYPGLYQAETD